MHCSICRDCLSRVVELEHYNKHIDQNLLVAFYELQEREREQLLLDIWENTECCGTGTHAMMKRHI